jgi:hypothetical protein
VIRRLVQQQDVGGAYQLSRQAKSSALSATQLFERLRAGFLRIEAQSLENGIHTRCERVAAFTIETLEVSIIFRHHLGCGGLTYLRELVCLFCKGKLQCEQVCKFTGAGFPYSLRTAEVAVLLEEAEAEAWLPGDDSFGRLMRAGDQPEECCLSTSIPAKNPPTVTPSYGECYSTKDLRRPELDTGIRNGYLSQERNTLEHAARQRSSDSIVWSPMWPIRNVEFFNFPYPVPTTIPRFATAEVKLSAGTSAGSLIADTVGD